MGYYHVILIMTIAMCENMASGGPHVIVSATCLKVTGPVQSDWQKVWSDSVVFKSALVSTLSLITMMRGSHVDLLNIPPPSPGEGGLRVSAGGEDQRAALRPQCHQNSLHKISSTLRGQTTQ